MMNRLCMPEGRLEALVNGKWDSVAITDVCDEELVECVKKMCPNAEELRFTDRYGNVEFWEV